MQTPPENAQHNPWSKSSTHNASVDEYPTEDLEGAEAFELLGDGSLHASAHLSKRPAYGEGSSIDWLWEEGSERLQQRNLHLQRGWRGMVAPILNFAKIWTVLVLTGVGIGTIGAWLDVLVRWLGDLREGRCTYGLFYNQVTCCSGLDAGEVCTEWQSWSQYFHVSFILGQSLLQSSIYIALAVAFAGSAALFVRTYAPYAFHTGIPEIKAILSGYVFDAFLSPWTLLIKAVGLALAVASGLSLGKEGPLVHVSCCAAYLLLRLFRFRHSEVQKRKFLAAAASAGVSVAFGSPLGGVLFALEELDITSFSNESEVMWRGFVTSVIAAVTLQYIDPFGTSKLVLFQVTGVADTWKAFELVPWLILAALGGVLGSLLIRLNAAAAVFRRNSFIHEWPVLEVVAFSAITAAISYLVVFLRVQSSDLVSNLFLECDPSKGDYHGLCNPTAAWENMFLLVITAGIKLLLTAWTFGMQIPAGIFLPTIAIGACLGRAIGLFTELLQRSYPTAWVFSACPPDPTVRCVSPGFYAVIGASAMLGGVTRMTVSLVVIVFELTGALSHVLPIMISVMVSKWVGDGLGKEGIYTVWIAMRQYPWLPPDEFRDNGQTAEQVVKPVHNLVIIRDEEEPTMKELTGFLDKHSFHGYPVVRGERLLGYVNRDELVAYLGSLVAEDGQRKCTFSKDVAAVDNTFLNLSSLLDEAVLQMRKEVPLQLVVNMFQKMNLRHVLFSQGGKLTGLVTKSDIVWLLTTHFPHTAALSERR
ncbi:chloride channel [Cristinia sonorae]|uniref:Chloride channel n=1 Tax=Cristinia sonorae TaxID=1940300 RepID=A0A8K0XJN5_9AGAR|nr:chloride channel [Cristinia sonorae]